MKASGPSTPARGGDRRPNAVGVRDAAEVIVPDGTSKPGDGLRVGGFVPFTTTDYPGALAAVVFCQGCPWRCPYCHNPHLLPAHGSDERDFARIRDWLGTRVGLLEAVVFSGGEPTAQAELPAAIDAVRAMGYLVGLHTGGAYPRRLAEVLPRVRWVGIDVKAPIAGYADLTGARTGGIAAFASLDLVLASRVEFEVRTTVHPSLTSPAALVEIARELKERAVRQWTLQPFRATGCTDARLVAAEPPESLLTPALLEELRAYVPMIDTRG